MRAGVNVFVAVMGWSAVIAAPFLFSTASSAEDVGSGAAGPFQEGADRWVPSIAVTSGVMIQEWKASVESTLFPGSGGAPEPVRPTENGIDVDVSPFVAGGVELMTPTLPIPTSPRLFAGGDLTVAFTFDRKVAREGQPGKVRSPLPEGGTLAFTEDVLLGQGAETEAKLDQLLYGAHVGVAFPVELFGRAMRLKPSVGWIRYQIDVNAIVSDGACYTPPPYLQGAEETTCNSATSFQRSISLLASGSETFDGIGPGLDIEMDTGRFGPLGTSLYLGARAFKILGSRSIELNDAATFDDPVGSGDEAVGKWSLEVNDWMYRVGVGIRFQWLGSK